MTSSEKVEEKLSVLKNQGMIFDVDLGFLQRKVNIKDDSSKEHRRFEDVQLISLQK